MCELLKDELRYENKHKFNLSIIEEGIIIFMKRISVGWLGLY